MIDSTKRWQFITKYHGREFFPSTACCHDPDGKTRIFGFVHSMRRNRGIFVLAVALDGDLEEIQETATMRTWKVVVERNPAPIVLGEVTAETEALARSAAIQAYRITEDDYFDRLDRGEEPMGISPGDIFYVTTYL